MFFPISKSIKTPYITQLKYCQKLDFEADPIHKIKTSIIKTIFSDLKIKEISLYNAIKNIAKDWISKRTLLINLKP